MKGEVRAVEFRSAHDEPEVDVPHWWPNDQQRALELRPARHVWAEHDEQDEEE